VGNSISRKSTDKMQLPQY